MNQSIRTEYEAIESSRGNCRNSKGLIGFSGIDLFPTVLSSVPTVLQIKRTYFESRSLMLDEITD